MDMMNPDQPQGEKVPCVHLYVMPDGSYKVTKDEGPAPAEGQEAASMDEAVELVRQMAEGGPSDSEDEDMEAAQAGYAKRAPGMMGAPNPGGVFGEG